MATKLNTLAYKLFHTREEISAFEDSIKPLKDQEQKLRDEMLDALKTNRMTEFKTDYGVAYSRAVRTSYLVSDMEKARPWLEEHQCLKPDTVKMGKLLKGNGEAIPQGIDFSETTYLTVTGMKAALDE
jgi:hypothetical protein